MSETEANGPVNERGSPASADANEQADFQAECKRLREQVKQLTKERDSLQSLVTLLRSKDEEDFYSIVRMIRDEITKGQTWNPTDEKDWRDFGQVLEELKQELGK